jgi:hypothetical protein
MSRNRPYAKYSFILSIVGFIGSLGFYFSVLQGVTNNESEKKLIEQLQHENEYLKKQINEFNLHSKSTDMKQLENENRYVQFMVDSLSKGDKLNRLQTEKIAKTMNIFDKTKIKELTEYAIVETARIIALESGDQKAKYSKIVDLYHRQTNLSFRTSQSILLKQYSTPAPIGYLMGVYCGIDSNTKTVFEPSAGNGLLTVATYPKMVTVNEIDKVRNENLQRQNYRTVLRQDASIPFEKFEKSYDAVITNPPFGRIGTPTFVGTYKIYDLDHYMAIIALDTLKDNGKSAIIIGGHTKYDDKGRIQAGKNRIFFNYLYHHYEVEDVIAIDGSKLYSRQGTAFDTRIILINGRKAKPDGVAPLQTDQLSKVVTSFDELYTRITSHMENKSDRRTKLLNRAKKLEANLMDSTLEGAYLPSSKGKSLDTQVPDSMDYEIHKALKQITQDVGGDMDNFVRDRLGYPTKKSLYEALSAEQIDAVGMAIYNIEALNQAIIIGDQTGIGKGRIASSMIRYAVHQGIKPIVLTEKANLFSDLYRDLEAIGSAHLRPFIVNAKESKTDIKDENGLVVYQAPSSMEQNHIFETAELKNYDFVIGTYSQFNSPLKKSSKPDFLRKIADGSILIMDESHNASGSSNTGLFMQSIVKKTKGAVFLSATFAKRPDNMPIYGMKTSISEANMSQQNLVDAIANGGVALQEILASQLVSEGQMIRRERSYEGVEVNYITLLDRAVEHKAIADNITTILRDIIAFQANYVDKRVGELDEIIAKEGAEIEIREGTSNAGVDNMPYFSKIFNVINQMLFSIKAESVADRAIERLKEGKKPVIAFASTMGSFLEQMGDENGTTVNVGDEVKADFSIVLEKGLEGIMRYTVTLPDGTKEYEVFDIDELGAEAKMEYFRIHEQIKNISTGITISPIDVIVSRIQKAGYSVGEVTGRKLKLQLNEKRTRGIVEYRKKINTNDAFREFNNNELDVLLINQSGSTGASAHAIVTPKVKKEQVKQRVMIVLQPELDINIEVQKRGRINRTGQILKPIYDYVNSAIPAEMRLMMMLQKKLKSLDANTSSNQKQSSSILDVPDFLNKYGDAIVMEYLKENIELNELLGDPLKLRGEKEVKEDGALKVSGRVAVLSVKMQEDFYVDIKERYDSHITYLKQTGDYDLEVEEMDLKTKTTSSSIIKMGKGGYSSFGEDSILEKVEANVLRKPFKIDELNNLIQQSLNGENSRDIANNLIETYLNHHTILLENELKEINDHYTSLIKDIPNEKKIQKIQKETPQLVDSAIEQRILELNIARSKKIEDQQKVAEFKKTNIQGLFKYFTIGKQLLYPVDSFSGSESNQMAVFLGFKMDFKKKNPYAPSAISLRFAIASSQKYLEIPASFNKEINAIKGASLYLHETSIESTFRAWSEKISEITKDRSVRYIITGNILQAFSDYKGKLVSYTTIDNKITKGILMPENWEIDKAFGGQVEVPIAKALRLFQSLPKGKDISTSHGITFFKLHDDTFRMVVGGVIREGGEIFLNQEILKLVKNNNFEKVGKNMSAYVLPSNIEPLLLVLESQIGVSVKMSESQIENVGLIQTAVKPKAKIRLPSKEEQTSDRSRRLRLRAKALELELALLTFKSKAS